MASLSTCHLGLSLDGNLVKAWYDYNLRLGIAYIEYSQFSLQAQPML